MVIMQKNILRTQMKEKRKILSEQTREDLSRKIFTKLSELPEYINAKSVCVYMDSSGKV